MPRPWLAQALVLAAVAAVSAAGSVPASGEQTCAAGSSSAECQAAATSRDEPESVAWEPKRISVVLPCAGEGAFALKTVKSVVATTPKELLHEIIVVDDGSNPPLEKTHLSKKVQDKFGVRILRHESAAGIAGAKKAGGDLSTGDFIVFFDCHVAPQEGWHISFLRLASANWRRIVVPVITNLDINTWRQMDGGGMPSGHSKCYLTWDADFKWFTSPDNDMYVPVLSGGLLGISRRWWDESGGYDSGMTSWGGENIDQSLRTWLCGGEIVRAEDSFVAHMWRKAEDPRTTPRYEAIPWQVVRNRLRALNGWFGDFSQKLTSYPHMGNDRLGNDGLPWYGNISNILEVKNRLQCKDLAWFFRHFPRVYESGGLLPKKTFALQASPSEADAKSWQQDLCLSYDGPPGVAQSGTGTASLVPCDPHSERQRWHGANRDMSKSGGPCCSGLRAWNSDQCINGVAQGNFNTMVCDLAGNDPTQFWGVTKEGQMTLPEGMGRARGRQAGCVEAGSSGFTTSPACRKEAWKRLRVQEPLETQLYKKWLRKEKQAKKAASLA